MAPEALTASLLNQPPWEQPRHVEPETFADVVNKLGEAINEPPLRSLPVIKTKVTRGYRPGVFASCVLCGHRPWDCDCDPDKAQQALLAKLPAFASPSADLSQPTAETEQRRAVDHAARQVIVKAQWEAVWALDEEASARAQRRSA